MTKHFEDLDESPQSKTTEYLHTQHDWLIREIGRFNKQKNEIRDEIARRENNETPY